MKGFLGARMADEPEQLCLYFSERGIGHSPETDDVARVFTQVIFPAMQAFPQFSTEIIRYMQVPGTVMKITVTVHSTDAP
jgi:hypothetical protein